MATSDEMSDLPRDPGVGPEDELTAFVRPSRPHRGLSASVLLAIAGGGVCGATARYALELALPTQSGHFPLGTFLINVSGSALLGFLLVVVIERFPERHLVRPLLGTGLIGAFTTFSTFAVEAVLLTRDNHLLGALAYVSATIVAGIGAGLAGMTGARAALRGGHWHEQGA